MSLLILDNVAEILQDLNKELRFKFSENTPQEPNRIWVHLETDGEVHRIIFLGKVIWDSAVEKSLEDIPPEMEMKLNERHRFEKHIKMLINDELAIFSNVQV